MEDNKLPLEDNKLPLEDRILKVPRWFNYAATGGLIATQSIYVFSASALMIGINEEFPKTMELMLPAYMIGTALGMFPVRAAYANVMTQLAKRF